MSIVSKSEPMPKSAPKPNSMELALAHIIDNARSERGWDIQELADRALDERTGRPIMSRSSLSRVLRGKRGLIVGEVTALCAALNLSILDVLGEARVRASEFRRPGAGA